MATLRAGTTRDGRSVVSAVPVTTDGIPAGVTEGVGGIGPSGDPTVTGTGARDLAAGAGAARPSVGCATASRGRLTFPIHASV